MTHEEQLVIYASEQGELLDKYKTNIAIVFGSDSIRLHPSELLSLMFPCSELRERIISKLGMTDKEALFAKFFTQAYNKGLSVTDMSFDELDAWVTELEEIVFEAKATLQGAGQARRERIAKLSADEREKLRDPFAPTDVSDALAIVKKRKDRMSKIEKLEETYRGLGMSEEDIKAMLGKISVKEDAAIPTAKPGAVKEESSKTEKTLLDKIVDSVLNAKDKPAPEPFDASSLFGKKGDKKEDKKD